MIKIQNSNKYYNKGKSNELHVINDTTITLPDTGLVCILGESGSGKTTLMNTVSGLDDFADGTIDVDGVAIKSFGDENQEKIRNEKFGYIFQNYYLLMDRTVEYNIMLALSMYDIPVEQKEERIEYVLRSVDMWRYKKRLVSQLSGGQQQRIAIARALAKSPKVIFADEPTGNLDEANTMNIMGILKKISEKCLVIVVTHEKAIADFFADKILWIADGKIEKELDQDCHAVYQYIDDNNLYLKEFEKKEIINGQIEADVFGHNPEQPITLRVVCENGKLYLNVADISNVEFLTEESDKEVIDSKRPVVEMNEMDNISYELEAIEGAKKPKITTREIVEIAVANIRSMGKKQIFLALTLFVISIMIAVSVQDILSVLHVDKQDMVTRDSHYYEVELAQDSYLSVKGFRRNFERMMDCFEEAGMEAIVIPNTVLTYEYQGFKQLENFHIPIESFSFVKLEQLKEEDLLYGEMPSGLYEVVLDKWFVENFIQATSEAEEIITDIKQVIGGKIATEQGYELEIVGICETEEPNIYANEEIIFLLGGTGSKIITESIAADEIEGFEKTELGIPEEDVVEVLVPESVLQERYLNHLRVEYSELLDAYNWVKECERWLEWAERESFEEDIKYAKEACDEAREFYDNIVESCGITYEQYKELEKGDGYKNFEYEGLLLGGISYITKGCYPDGANVDYVIADEALDIVKIGNISVAKRFYLYVEDTEGDVEQRILDAITDDTIERNLTINIVNEFENAEQDYQEEIKEQFGSRILVVITIFLISLIILYFIMKSNAIARMQDLGVYRMLGISKKSIIGMFAYENFIITSYTSVLGVLLTAVAGMVISGIESFQTIVIYPWYAVLLTIVFLYVANIFVGILPIMKMLKLPPAQLAAKYDI